MKATSSKKPASFPGLFPLGHIVATPGALELAESVFTSQATFALQELLTRHYQGDWGDIAPEDARKNDAAVKRGNRILSSYTLLGGGKLWIITEADRSSTTILLPSEY